MKTQLIMSPQPILVSDEHAIDNDVVMYVKSCFILKSGNLYDLNSNVWRCMPNPDARKQPFQKVIAGISVLPSIDWSALSKEDSEKIGWVDISMLAENFKEFEIKTGRDLSHAIVGKYGFYEGFKAAQSLCKNKFTLEDVKLIWKAGQEYWKTSGASITLEELLEKIKQHSSEPKVFDVEIEMEKVYLINDKWVNYFESSFFPHLVEEEKLQPKITNNSIKILKVSDLQ